MQSEVVEKLINKTNIAAFVHTNDIIDGKKYDANRITALNKKETIGITGKVNYFWYEVDDEEKPTYYDVSIIIENGKKIIRTSCDCRENK